MRIVMVVAIVIGLVGGAFAECPIYEPYVEQVRLLSWGEATSIIIYVSGPFEGGMFDIRWAVFNLDGKKVRILTLR